jgi:1,4-alpha-glucan branching enzyme
MAKREKPSESTDQTVFVCHAPDAESVFLAGTFNDWDSQSTPMHRRDDGTWRMELALSPGRYEYKFVVDGRWCCDPGDEDRAVCPHGVPNCFGTMNRVIDVGDGGSAIEVGGGDVP